MFRGMFSRFHGYLEEHRPGLYEQLFLSGRFYEHLADIDQSSAARLEVMIPAIAAAEGVDEALKAPGSDCVGCGR